jgi:hypothetical protein
MILTQDKINNAVLKAFCKMADKSVKYYKGLSVGVNNDCLLREAVLLNQYIDNIKCFKIVGSTEQCDCCIEGDYKVILPNDKIYYFQFGCDSNGYLLTEDNGGYDFTYCYDETNNQLVMSYDVDYSYQSYFTLTDTGSGVTVYAVYLDGELIYFNPAIEYTDFIDDFNSTNTYGYYLTASGILTIINKTGFYTSDDIEILESDSVFNLILGMVDEGPLVIRFEDVDFTEECNFNYSGAFPWYYTSELEVTGTPILTDDGLMTIQNPLGGNIVTPLVIPVALLTDPQDIVDYWNANRASTNFTLSYNGTEYVMESPADFVNYYSHTFNFTQLETVNVIIPGNKATASCTNTEIGDKNEFKILKAYVNSSEIGSYTILSGDGADSAAQLAFKLENTFTYSGTSSVVGASINLTAPTDGTAYNGTTYELKLITPEVLPRTADIIFTNTGGNTNSFQVILQSTSLLLGQVNNTGLLTNIQLAAAISASINSGTGTHGFSAQYFVGSNNFRLIAPVGSGSTYGLAEIILQCNPDPGSTIATGVVTPAVGTRSIFFTPGINEVIVDIDDDTFTGGTNPTTTPEIEPVTYTSEFNVIVDDELTYENLNPCTPTVIEQTCLTNEQVITIINNINKI